LVNQPLREELASDVAKKADEKSSFMAQDYDLVVIGSGSGGREAALLAARKGLRTAIIERGGVGGACFHRGCYAVRALQACARQFRDRRKSGRFGNKVDLLKETLNDWMAAQRMVTLRLVDNFRAELQRLNVDLIRGQGVFLDDRTLQVIDEHGLVSTITAENIIVATGSRPDFQDSARPRMVNSDALLRTSALPERLAIIGAGYVGCEFASIYRTLGSEVTLIEKANRVLPGWEPEAADRVAEALEMRGVKIVRNHQVAFSEIQESETNIRICSQSGQPVDADVVLVATGRRPNTEGLALKALGIDDSSTLKVDAHMRLPNPRLYAVGDVTGLSLLDSTAFSQANVAINSILGHESRYDPRWIPRCIHTEPPIAAVGLPEDEAARNGIEFNVVSANMRLASDDERSVIDPEPTFLKAVVDSHSRNLLGCLVVGDHAAVIANVAAIAIHLKTPIDQLRDIPLAQPSAADALFATLRKLD
jgi:pyruvate/2-oxoglutarate dehydrogenase complex dihydrolipoamide dehydrogenase (E3) component